MKVHYFLNLYYLYFYVYNFLIYLLTHFTQEHYIFYVISNSIFTKWFLLPSFYGTSYFILYYSTIALFIPLFEFLSCDYLCVSGISILSYAEVPESRDLLQHFTRIIYRSFLCSVLLQREWPFCERIRHLVLCAIRVRSALCVPGHARGAA